MESSNLVNYNYILLIGIVCSLLTSAHQVSAARQRITLRDLINEDIKAEEAEYELLREETRKLLNLNFLISSPSVLNVNTICGQELYNIDGATKYESLYYNCEQCCEHQGKGAWIEDKERALAEGKKCSCKPQTHLKICEFYRNSDECRRCCLSENTFELYLRMDEEISFKNGEECLCHVRFLGKTNI